MLRYQSVPPPHPEPIRFGPAILNSAPTLTPAQLLAVTTGLRDSRFRPTNRCIVVGLWSTVGARQTPPLGACQLSGEVSHVRFDRIRPNWRSNSAGLEGLRSTPLTFAVLSINSTCHSCAVSAAFMQNSRELGGWPSGLSTTAGRGRAIVEN